ncbi:hypothetical protein Thimo_0397 [Thioflavicoccus mobilis 8321]|uniref:Uncharacterized protein n=2 Tax=Thioflavicoccus mobilis TaxID=80679 RepID=L0GV66_9GAMM|nr:hypothetical protein Thimo_0397 [Thioflavicoccus mobilis 8321]
MLGEFSDWAEFCRPSTVDYSALPRRQLKSGYADVQHRLKAEIKKFCEKNFVSLDSEGLASLYEDILPTRGLEMPLHEFERKHGKINPEALKGAPPHLTVSISLWGLKFRFPEDLIAKDIAAALQLTRIAQQTLRPFHSLPQSSISERTSEFVPSIRNLEFAQRATVLSCFNLLEAYLNGLAWDYCRSNSLEHLSKRKAKLLQDTASASIRDKVDNYPWIISGKAEVPLEGRTEFLEQVKPFRDSLVHPSPFTAPEKFGGYQKLQKFYELDEGVMKLAVVSCLSLIASINHVVTGLEGFPEWCKPINDEIDQAVKQDQLTSA